MNFATILLSVFSFLWPWQTTEPVKQASLDEAFTVKVGQKVEIKDANLQITFTAVEDDSRCPAGVTCVWAGNAKLNIEVKRSKKKYISTSLNTTLNPKDVDYKGYKIKLVGITPNRKADAPLDPAEYEATIIVTNK